MKSILSIKQFLFSGSLHREYLWAILLFALIAWSTYEFRGTLGDFLWQAFLGIFTGVFVGYLVDAVESWYRTRSIRKILSFLRVDKAIPVIIADRSIHVDDVKDKKIIAKIGELFESISESTELQSNDSLFRLKNVLHNKEPLRDTGPGESIAIGLFYSAYFTLFSTSSKPANSSIIQVMSPEIDNPSCKYDYPAQRLIFGGPRYNQLTRYLLANDKVPIHYPEDEIQKYRGELHLKDGTQSWKPPTNGGSDYGLILRLKSQIHVSGCQTWGVAGAAKCIFSESAARQLVEKLRSEKIDPISDDYFAVIYCEVPVQVDHYTIGDVGIAFVQRIQI